MDCPFNAGTGPPASVAAADLLPASVPDPTFALTQRPARAAWRPVFRHQLKSKLHRARITDANIDYEGSISIPTDLMEAVDIWEGEKVLVTSLTNGARLETYVIPGKAGSRHIVVNGAAAHLINTGHIVTIMAFGLDAEPVTPKRALLNERNEIVTAKVL